MRRVLPVLAVAGLVVLAACGGDKKESSSATTTTTSSATGTVTTFSGTGSSAFCGLARDNIGRVQQQLSAALAASPAERKRLLGEAAPIVRQIEAAAPSEIKADVTVLADAFDKLVASDDPTLDISTVTNPEFTAAAQRLTAYASTVCGITPAS